VRSVYSHITWIKIDDCGASLAISSGGLIDSGRLFWQKPSTCSMSGPREYLLHTQICRRELQRRRPTSSRSGASKGWARSPSVVVSLSPDTAHGNHTPSRSREWCIAAKLACRMSRRRPLTRPKAASARHARLLGICLPAGFTGDACSTPANRRRRPPSVHSDWLSRPGTPGSDSPNLVFLEGLRRSSSQGLPRPVKAGPGRSRHDEFRYRRWRQSTATLRPVADRTAALGVRFPTARDTLLTGQGPGRRRERAAR
jgi:hypothetical protein